ncbi:MAG: DUF4920 domain-containing protein [Bacteroidetes bacterium]|nr:DUF4920 domain-containing protein [Bacteroidota bacterium]
MKFYKVFCITLGISWLFLASACQQPINENKENTGEAMQTEHAALPPTGNFGAVIQADGSTDINSLSSAFDSENPVAVKVYGTVADVCQHSGCWLTLKQENGEDIMVNMKDESFSVPKDASGKKAWVEGIATREKLTVDVLKHMAADEGKSQEEIDAITLDSWKYSIEAVGVIIQ